jgi:hypothetical protein
MKFYLPSNKVLNGFVFPSFTSVSDCLKSARNGFQPFLKASTRKSTFDVLKYLRYETGKMPKKQRRSDDASPNTRNITCYGVQGDFFCVWRTDYKSRASGAINVYNNSTEAKPTAEHTLVIASA